MITLLEICLGGTALLAMIIFAIFMNTNDDLKGCFWGKLALTLVVGLGGCMIGFIIYLICTLFTSADISNLQKKEEIMCLKDNSNITGSFSSGLFFGSGMIGEEMYYIMYVKTNSGVVLKKIRSDDATIVFTKNNHKLITKWKEFAKTKHNKFIGRFGYINYNIIKTKYIIQIPDTTVSNTYKLDGE